MPKHFGEQPREEVTSTETEQKFSPTPEYLQGLIHNLEINQKQLSVVIKTGGRKEVADALQRQVDKLQAEIDKIEPDITREKNNKERDRFVVENFGQEILNEAEGLAKGIGVVIKERLLTAKNKRDAERILALWRDFEEAISFERPGKAEKVLEEAYDSMRPDKIGKR